MIGTFFIRSKGRIIECKVNYFIYSIVNSPFAFITVYVQFVNIF